MENEDEILRLNHLGLQLQVNKQYPELGDGRLTRYQRYYQTFKTIMQSKIDENSRGESFDHRISIPELYKCDIYIDKKHHF